MHFTIVLEFELPSSYQMDSLKECSCSLIPCSCIANVIADHLHVSPLYHQHEGERWRKAEEMYEEITSRQERPSCRIGMRTKSRSDHSMMSTEPLSIPCLRCGGGTTPPFGSLPISLHKVSSMNRSLACSQEGSRGDSGCTSLELEAVAAMHELSFAVQSICVSEMLPRTGDLIFVNVTTIEGQPYCLELTLKGWRVASLRSDCMIGDFTKLHLFTKYYDTLYSLLDDISTGYRERFGERLAKKLMMLQNDDSNEPIAPSSSYSSPPFSLSPCGGSTDSLPVVTPVPSPVPDREDKSFDRTVIA